MRLFSVFKALVARPLFVAGVLCALLFPLSGAFFFQQVSVSEPLSFAEEKSDLELALTRAAAEFESARGSDQENALRRKVLFFESALRFEVAVWSDRAMAEIVSDYAQVRAAWEIALDHPTEHDDATRLGAEETRLCTILQQKNTSDYLALVRERLSADPALSPEDVAKQTEDVRLRLLALSYHDKNAAANLLLSEINTLRESLFAKHDFYHLFAEKTPWNNATETQLSHLLAQRVFALETGAFDASPANTDTLFFIEKASVFLFVLGLFCALPAITLTSSEKPALPWVLVLLCVGFCLALSLALYGAVKCFAPATFLPTILFAGRVRTIPFLVAVFTRLCLNTARAFLFLLFALCLIETTKRKRRFAFLSFLTYGAFCLGSPLTRLFFGASRLLPFFPFAYFDLAEAFFPETPRYLPSPSRTLSSMLFATALIPLFLWYYRAIGKEKQESEHPKQSDTSQTAKASDLSDNG